MATLNETLEKLGDVQLTSGGGAAATEEKRDAEAWKSKQLTLLERIAEAVGMPKGNGKPTDKPGGLLKGLGIASAGGLLSSLASTIAGGAKGGLSALSKGAAKAFTNPKIAKMMGPLAIAGGVALMVKDGMAAMKMSEEWGTSKTSAAMGGVLGGMDSGFKGAMKNMGKWALIGAGIGSVVPVIGTLVGGVIGAVIGAILGWIGGEKIAKFFESVGKWASKKWDEIKEFPGKIWDAVVGTVKGWLGLGPKAEIPVEVDGGPEKGWLDSIIDFLIPDWLVSFAKDALSTVTGWLGLTAKDDQGKVTTTNFGKLVFGTIGQLTDFAMSIIGFFIPQFIKDFVKSPLSSVLSWLGLAETDAEGEIKPTELGTKIFGTVTKVVDIMGSIIRNIIGDKTVDAIMKFFKNPLDYILVDLLGWKTETGVATAAGLEAVKKLEQKDVLGLFGSIVKKIIGEKIYTAITDFVDSPINYIMVHWLGWKTEEGEKTKTGMEAQAKLDKGNITGLFGMIIDAIIPKGLIEFVKDPIDYIFVNWLKLGSKTDVDKVSTAEKAGVIAGAAVGLWEKLLKAILPDKIVDFIMSPINWVFGLFGMAKPSDTLASVEEAHGLTVGDEESRTGIFNKILTAILPAGVLKFIENPLNWILETFLGAKAVALIAGGTVEDAQSIIKKSKVDPAGLFDQIVKKVIPQGLLDFIDSPINYILKNWLGITPGAKPKDVDMTNPDIDKGSKGETVKKEMAQSLYDAIGGLGWGVGSLFKKVMDPEDMLGILGIMGFAKGGQFSGKAPIMVGEMGPELIMPSTGGIVMNAQRTQEIQEAGLRRGAAGGGGGGATIINAPTTMTNQSSSMTNTSVSLSHPSRTLAAVNAAA